MRPFIGGLMTGVAGRSPDVIDISGVVGISDQGFGSGGSATLEFLPGGTWDTDGTNSIDHPAVSGNWCSNHPPVSNYWIRATITAGTAFSSGSGAGTWIALSGGAFWNNVKSTSGTKSTTITIEIATDAAGSNIIATKTGIVISAQF